MPKKSTIRQARYDATHIVQVKMKLHRVNDKDILDKLEAVENKQGYIKDLIRKDLASEH